MRTLGSVSPKWEKLAPEEQTLKHNDYVISNCYNPYDRD